MRAFFQRRLIRALVLAVTVFATVATSEPSWSLKSETAEHTATLEPGQSFVRGLDYEASHHTKVVSRVTAAAEEGAELRASHQVDGAASNDPQCSVAGTYARATGEDAWSVVGDADGPLVSSRDIVLRSECGAERGRMTVRFENVGRVPVELRWRSTAYVGGRGDSDPPDGAFVRLKVAP